MSFLTKITLLLQHLNQLNFENNTKIDNHSLINLRNPQVNFGWFGILLPSGFRIQLI